jgi:hypothetical protein
VSLPTDQILRGPIAKRALDRGGPELGHLFEQFFCHGSGCVVGVDENGQPRGICACQGASRLDVEGAPILGGNSVNGKLIRLLRVATNAEVHHALDRSRVVEIRRLSIALAAPVLDGRLRMPAGRRRAGPGRVISLRGGGQKALDIGIVKPYGTRYSVFSKTPALMSLKGMDMANNSKQTSSRVASVAGKTLQSQSASAVQKSLAGSALRQAGSSAQTGAATEQKASRALDSSKSASVTRTLAGSVVSQSNRSR